MGLSLDGGNSAFVTRALVETTFGVPEKLYLKHFRASEIALTKARLLNHDLYFHGHFSGGSKIALFGRQNALLEFRGFGAVVRPMWTVLLKDAHREPCVERLGRIQVRPESLHGLLRIT